MAAERGFPVRRMHHFVRVSALAAVAGRSGVAAKAPNDGNAPHAALPAT